jgi:protein-disulfide isomerase
MRFLARLALAAGLMLTLGTFAGQAQSFSDAQRGEIEKVIREYLLQHPEVLQEAMNELEKKQAADEAIKNQAAVKDNAATIFNSPRQVTVGNPQGDVTFVEFFDYNCGYCKRAMDDMFAMMKSDPKLKVVLKEFPVLGPGSVEAARVAVAVRMQDKTGGKKYIEFHQKLLGGRGQADKARALAVAKEVGMDMARLEKDMASDEVKATLEENLKIAEKLGLNGTPSYVIGTNVVIGAVGLDKLKESVSTARCGKATC